MLAVFQYLFRLIWFDHSTSRSISLSRYAPEAEADASLVMATQHALYNLGGGAN